MAPSFVEENENSEAWLHTQCDVVKKGLKAKYKRMASHAFDFLRATCFRWASGIKSELPELADTPIAVSVGDLHAENYGTWRDVEGRWVWGVNDFDEAAEIPFAYIWRGSRPAWRSRPIPGSATITRPGSFSKAIATG